MVLMLIQKKEERAGVHTDEDHRKQREKLAVCNLRREAPRETKLSTPNLELLSLQNGEK